MYIYVLSRTACVYVLNLYYEFVCCCVCIYVYYVYIEVKVIFTVAKQLLKAVVKKAKKKIWGFNGIWTYDFRDTGAMLYQLSYEALLETGQEQVQLIPVIWKEWDRVHVHMKM